MNETYEIQKKLLDLSNLKFNKKSNSKRKNATLKQLEQLNKIGFSKQKNLENDVFLKLPTFKFLHSNIIKDVCKKYNLVFGDVEDFIETIPEKNATELLKNYTQVLKKLPHLYYIIKSNRFNSKYYKTEDFIKKYGEDNLNKLLSDKKLELNNLIKTEFEIFNKYDTKLKIIAPLTYFNTSNKKLDGYKLKSKDPIVLLRVEHKIWAVLTAWGPESQDANIFNEIVN